MNKNNNKTFFFFFRHAYIQILKPYEEISTDNTQDTNFKKLTPNIKSKAILKLNI